MRTIPEILCDNAARWPDRAAIIATRRGQDRVVTYAELEQAAHQFAARLREARIGKGDPVLVFVPMSIELYVALFGIFQAGAVATFLDPSSGLRHINACCAMLPPAAFVGIWPLRLLRPFVSSLRRIPRVFAPPIPNGPEERVACPCTPDDPALMTFTSGSTGQPKAAVRSHAFLVAQHEALKTSIALEPGEVDLTTLPIFVLANLASGVTSVLPDGRISRPGFVKAAPIARQARRLATTRTGGSPAFYERLAGHPDGLSGFRKIYTGGAPVFPSLLERLQKAAPEAEVVAVYGSTEAEPIAHVAFRDIAPADWDAMRKGGGLLTGKPIEEITLRIVADQWGEPAKQFDSLATRQIGEIVVTGGHVLQGYLHGKSDEETKVRHEDAIWHRTGDAGYLDEHGRLWLLGRCAAKVRDAHGVLYPFAVECVAMTFAFIHRAAFVAAGGRRILVLEGKSRLSSNDSDALRERLAWAHLDAIKTLPRIPVDARHNSKVNYPALNKILRSRSR